MTENHGVPFETSFRITSWSLGRTHKTWNVQILKVWQQRWQQSGRHQMVTGEPVPIYRGVRSAYLWLLCGRGGTNRGIHLLTLNHLVLVRIQVRQLLQDPVFAGKTHDSRIAFCPLREGMGGVAMSEIGIRNTLGVSHAFLTPESYY